MKASEQIAKLRERGYGVYTTHIRPVVDEYPDSGEYFTRRELAERGLDGDVWETKGGVTEVVITDPYRKDIYHTGIAVCSREDNFCKSAGVNIALGRAVSAMCHGTKLAGPGQKKLPPFSGSLLAAGWFSTPR